jgi:histone chaperone ASF1
MSIVSLLGIKVLNNPAKFTDNYQFEITFECLEQLEKGTLRAASHARCCSQINVLIPRPGVEIDLCRIRNLVSL